MRFYQFVSMNYQVYKKALKEKFITFIVEKDGF
jgi:hypothetical protein